MFGMLLRIVALVTVSAPLGAQVYSTAFDDDVGWTFVPGSGTGFAWWDVDATPAQVLGVAPYHSTPTSLNFNDGICYGGGTSTGCVGISSGRATSPSIDLTAPAGTAELGFWCLWDTETGGACYFDRRTLLVSNDGFSSTLVSQCLDDSFCGPAGAWHEHAIALDPAWGVVQLRFEFDSHDSFDNVGAGWFVDDLEVELSCPPPASYCTAKINSLGCTPSTFSTGVPSIAANTFRVKAQNVLSNKMGLLFWGLAEAASPFQGGTLCVLPPTKRTPLQDSAGNAPPTDCSGTYSFHFSASFMASKGLVAGQRIYAQYWTRDAGTPSGTGLTDGHTFVVCP